MRRACLFALALAAIAVFAGSLQAGEGEAAPAPEPDATAPDEAAAGAPAESPSTLHALRVYRDPATGELTFEPPPGAARVLSEALARRVSRSSEGLRSRTLPDGTSVLDLQGRFLQLSVARRGADGSLESECVTDAPRAEAFLGAGSTEDEEDGKEDRHDR